MHVRSVAAFLISSLFAVQLYAEPVRSKDPIRVITNDWTSQIVMAHIAGMIFKKLGYQVIYSSIDTDNQWGALSRGRAHVQVEVWEGSMSEMFYRLIQLNRIIDAGNHDAKTREDWWYPAYVEELCPELPDWRALNECAHLFSDNTSQDHGIYLAGPWEKPEAARIRALGLKFRVKHLLNADELWSYLIQAVSVKKPILMFNWTPNWVEARHPGKFVEFPEYAPACETDPKWGHNPLFLYDCGNPKNGWLKKVAWSGMPEKWPCAYSTLRNINFSNQMISHVAARVDVDDLTHQTAAKEWVENHKDLWQSWIPEECQIKAANPTS